MYTGSCDNDLGFREPRLSRTEERPFPHFQVRCVAETVSGPFRLGGVSTRQDSPRNPEVGVLFPHGQANCRPICRASRFQDGKMARLSSPLLDGLWPSRSLSFVVAVGPTISTTSKNSTPDLEKTLLPRANLTVSALPNAWIGGGDPSWCLSPP